MDSNCLLTDFLKDYGKAVDFHMLIIDNLNVYTVELNRDIFHRVELYEKFAGLLNSKYRSS